MEETAVRLFVTALEVALLLAVPLVAVVALVGIVIGVLQTVVQVQDQNVSFLPKLIAIAAVLSLGGATGLSLLVRLMVNALAALPKMVGH
ncbi:MAG TPA: flagellar biosynthetic protein FliQ [Candidatus Tumulicola sp.]|nr:flagellar biosynthetic protein FliQ [Candidatus Tumulicola sp.]